MPPTRKQKLAMKIALANPSKQMGEVMREAGYSQKTSKTPQLLTERKGWLQLLEKKLPDELLLNKHMELLTVPRKVRTYVKGALQTETEEVDAFAIGKGLDMAYKLKGRYAPEKHDHDIHLPTPILGGLSQDAVQDNDSDQKAIETNTGN